MLRCVVSNLTRLRRALARLQEAPLDFFSARPLISPLVPLLIAVFLLDQTTKFAAQALDWRVIINTGVSFGIGGLVPAPIMSLLLLALVGALAFFAREYWLQHWVAAGLLFGGALGNIFDRLLFGGVRDWLATPVLGLYNNAADWAIGLAVVLLCLAEFREWQRSKGRGA